MQKRQERVFISRFLKGNSIFLQRLTEAGFEVVGESLIEFEAVLFNSVPEVDWIFFYSGKGVRFFFETVETQRLVLPKGVQFAALGAGTAKKFPAAYAANFIGNGKPEEVAAQFLAIANGKRVLFPRAKHSRQSVQQLLEAKIQAVDLVVYENKPRKDFELPDCAYLVFTSPMNAEAYFSKKELQPQQKIIAIGQTTAGKLAELKVENITVATAPTEEALAEAVLANV